MGTWKMSLLPRSVFAWQFACLLIGLAASLVPFLPKTYPFWGCLRSWTSLTPNQVRIIDVLPNSPASAAGLKDGDWVLSIDGRQIDSAGMWDQMKTHLLPGQQAQLRVKRNEKEMTLTAVGFEPQLEAIVYGNWQLGFAGSCIVFLILLVATKPLRPLPSLWRPILLVLAGLAGTAVLLYPDWRGNGLDLLLGRRWLVDKAPLPWPVGNAPLSWVQLFVCVAVALGSAALGAWEIRGILLARPGTSSRADLASPVPILAPTDSPGDRFAKQFPVDAAAATASGIAEADAPKNSAPTGPWAPDSQLENPWPVLPTAFGRYELQKLLGRGAMGMVFLAHDRKLDRLVALKIPQFTGPRSDAFRERFLREARAAAKLSHPNLCPLYDVGDGDGVPYLTMPVIEGVPLSEIFRRSPLPTPQQAARWVHDIALAVQEVHRHGMIHRDLKPSNLMVNGCGEPIVMDFGLAYQAAATSDPRLTQSGYLLGTPAYMAPEQAMGETQAVAPSSDVYSLGVVLYELLTGRAPFQGPTLGKLLAQIERDPPPSPSYLRPDLDPALERICLRALAKRPGDRFASMADFAAALAPFAPGVPPRVEISDTLAGLPQSPRRSGRRPWLHWGTAAVHHFRTWSRRFASFCALRRRITLVVAVALLAFGCYFYFAKRHQNADPVSRETYLQIKENMSEMEVNELLLGAGIVVHEEGQSLDVEGNFRHWTANYGARHETSGRLEKLDGRAFEHVKKEVRWDSGEKSIFVTFNDGRVVSKREIGLYKKP